MKEYTILYSKAYYASGTFTVQANSPEEAEEIADTMIGDETGNMQYCPDDNVIEVAEGDDAYTIK